jgi:hypothetical protein
VRLGAARKGVDRSPVLVRIHGGDRDIEELLQTPEARDFLIPCGRLAGAARDYPPSIHLTLAARPPHLRAGGRGGDAKILGVKVYLQSPKVLVPSRT